MKAVYLALDSKFRNIDGTGNMLNQNETTETTVRDVVKIALASELKMDTEGSQAEVVENRIKNFELLMEVQKPEDVIVLTPEQADYLKKRVAFIFGTLIAGPMIKMLGVQKEVPVPAIEDSTK